MRGTRVAAAAAASLAIFAHAPHARAQQSDGAALTVSTAWLAERLRDPDLVLLHVGAPAEYPKAHLPGARLVRMDDISVSNHDHDKDTGLALELPPADVLRAKLEALGVSERSRIVVYFANGWVTPATRAVFTLDAAGLGARTSLLDGGLAAWTAEGRPTTTEEPPPPAAGKLSPLKMQPLVVDAAWVRANAAAPNVRVIDGRAAVFYDGVQAGGPRKGHIPGARSIPYTEVADASMKFKSTADLAALFAKAGVQKGDTVVAYCHIGQQGTAVLFAARLLGHPVKLYDASFQEWARRTDLPVDNPADGRRP